MKRSFRPFPGLYAIGVAALFLAGFFLLVVFGAQTYRKTVAVQAENNKNRALLSYFATCISANDCNGAVSVRDSGYGPVLSIPDGNSGYGLQIYCQDGKLMETYTRRTMDPDPENDTVIGQTQVFRAELLQDDLLRITTDAGSTLIRMRSEGGRETG